MPTSAGWAGDRQADGGEYDERVNLLQRALVGMAAAGLLLAAVVATVGASTHEEHPVVGRFAIVSAAGGAVWAFQPSGVLVVIGPGEIISEGTWSAASEPRDFDARVEVAVSGQSLEVLGQVRDDGEAVAIHVTASEPARPDDWPPWPTESRLLGERLGMTTEPEPSPTLRASDCARPEWIEDSVDWGRCDVILPTTPPG